MNRFAPVLFLLMLVLVGCNTGTPNGVATDAEGAPTLLAASPAPAAQSPTPYPTPVSASPTPSPSPARWQPLGPAGITTSAQLPGPFSGRVAVAAADPTNPDVVYAASEYGGIFKTVNFQSVSPNWVPLTDFMPSTNVGCRCLAVAPSNPNLVYAAAGVPNGGLLVSTDAGATFTELGRDVFADAVFGGLAVHPTTPTTLYVAVQGGQAKDGEGVYRSTDGGVTWTNVTHAVHPQGFATDVIIDAQNPNVLFAGLVGDKTGQTNGIYRSVDGGTTWAQLHGGGIPSGAAVGSYVVVAQAPSDPNVLYALVFDPSQQPEEKPLRYRTDDALSATPTWVALTPWPKGEDSRSNHQTLGVNPASPMHVYGNGDDGPFIQSFDGGIVWQNYFGEDPTAITFNGNGDAIPCGDRGIYLQPKGSGFLPSNRQGDLENNLFYDVEAGPGPLSQMIGVAQDQFDFLSFNGSTTWSYATAGEEVGRIKFDPVNAGIVYAFTGEIPPISFLKSTDDGATWTAAENGIDTTVYGTDPKEAPAATQGAHNALDMDPTNPSRLVVGTYQVYETTNGAASWTPISPNPLGGAGAYVEALAIAPSAPQTLYAATSDGQMFVSANDGGTWRSITAGLPTFGEPNVEGAPAVGQIIVDPGNAGRVFVIIGSESNSVTPQIYVTSNGGTTWSNFGVNLPPLRVISAAIDFSKSPLTVYAGTMRGLFASFDGGATWSRYGVGLPNVIVRSIVLRLGRMIVGTYGRSAWTITTPP